MAKDPTFQEVTGCQRALFEWADSYDTKDWERLKKCVAPTLRIDYRSFMDKLWEAMPCDEFIMMASDQRFLGNPLLKTQHFVGLSTWQKVSDDEVIGTHQVRVPHQRYTDSSMREVAVKGHSHGTATMWYKRVELEWKFAGVCPHIRWCEYDYDKVFAEGKDHYGEKAENEENEEKGVKEANREKARKEEKIEKAGKEANGANEANGADHYAYIKSDPTDQVAMHASAEVQAATLEKFIDGWSKWTPDDFLASWSENCTQTALPFGSGSPTHSRAELEHLFPKLMSTLTNFQLKIHNALHDSAHDKATLYAVTKADTPFGPYNNEHAVFIWFNERGEINKIEEMFDSAFMNDFRPKLHQYFAQKAQAQDVGA